MALAAGVYIWNAADGSIVQLCQREGEEEYVTSVSWIAQVAQRSWNILEGWLGQTLLLIKQGNVLGVGNSDGTVQLWDVASSKLIRSMAGHTDRVRGLFDIPSVYEVWFNVSLFFFIWYWYSRWVALTGISTCWQVGGERELYCSMMSGEVGWSEGQFFHKMSWDYLLGLRNTRWADWLGTHRRFVG